MVLISSKIVIASPDVNKNKGVTETAALMHDATTRGAHRWDKRVLRTSTQVLTHERTTYMRVPEMPSPLTLYDHDDN